MRWAVCSQGAGEGRGELVLLSDRRLAPFTVRLVSCGEVSAPQPLAQSLHLKSSRLAGRINHHDSLQGVPAHNWPLSSDPAGDGSTLLCTKCSSYCSCHPSPALRTAHHLPCNSSLPAVGASTQEKKRWIQTDDERGKLSRLTTAISNSLIKHGLNGRPQRIAGSRVDRGRPLDLPYEERGRSSIDKGRHP
ncbi:hypothetical protein GN956_G21724 [Arapaima gigas]